MAEIIFKEKNWEKFDPQWMERIRVILEDLAEVGAIKFLMVLDEKGNRLVEPFYPNGPFKSPLNHEKLLPIKQLLQLGFDEELPLYLTEKVVKETTLIGFAAEMILVLVYENSANHGAINMRFEKRIRHMRNVYQGRIKRATIV